MLSPSEIVTARFYEWERRGRGWLLCDAPVKLEPEYSHFTGHYVPSSIKKVDTAKKQSLVSRILKSFRKNNETTVDIFDGIDAPSGIPLDEESEDTLSTCLITLPREDIGDYFVFEELLLMISDTNYPISFEIVCQNTLIHFQFVIRLSDYEFVISQIKAYFPTLQIATTETNFFSTQNAYYDIVDIALSDEFLLPIRTLEKRESDCYIGLLAALEMVQKNESCIIQILFQGAHESWASSMLRLATDNSGKASFLENVPELPKYTKEKINSSLVAVSMRILAISTERNRPIIITKSISQIINKISQSTCNSLIQLSNDGYDIYLHYTDFVLRRTRRLGMLLNTTELTTFLHFPSSEVVSTRLQKTNRKTKLAPTSTIGHSMIIGTNTHNGQSSQVSISPSLRLRHTHIIGATGTGKSTLLLSMISQDITNGNGLAVLDPHGDLIESVLTYIPDKRLNDVILIDPADIEYPFGFNVLQAHSDIEKEILSSDLVAAFRRLSTSWGDQMNSVLANAILAFLESTEGGTLLDLRRFLVEKTYRNKHLTTVSDPNIVYYWHNEYPLLKSSSIGSILTRLDTFLRPKVIRNMVAQKKSLDFEQILDSGKILLIKLSQGLIGSENSYLLGTFFVSKIYQAAMARQAKSKVNRIDFFFYIDEFHHFATPSMSLILSGARKYHLGLILAHQDMAQLSLYDSELASSVMVNAGTRICFRLGDNDARRFASGFSFFGAQDLENLHTGEAIARVEQPNYDFNFITIQQPIISQERSIQAIILASRNIYAKPRAYIEQFVTSEYTTIKELFIEQDIVSLQQSIDKPAFNHKQELQTFTSQVISKPEKLEKKPETEHRYIQMFIKRTAEARGFKVVIEQLTPDGSGRVDICLQRDGQKIAIEVSVTTNDSWEFHNIEKCLVMDYSEVIVCSNNPKNLQKIKNRAYDKLAKQLHSKVLFFTLDEVVTFLNKKILSTSPKEKIVKGYKIKTEYD